MSITSIVHGVSRTVRLQENGHRVPALYFGIELDLINDHKLETMLMRGALLGGSPWIAIWGGLWEKEKKGPKDKKKRYIIPNFSEESSVLHLIFLSAYDQCL